MSPAVLQVFTVAVVPWGHRDAAFVVCGGKHNVVVKQPVARTPRQPCPVKIPPTKRIPFAAVVAQILQILELVVPPFQLGVRLKAL